MLCNMLLTIKIQMLLLHGCIILFCIDSLKATVNILICLYFFRFFNRKYVDNSEHVEFHHDVHWIVSVSSD